MKSTTPSPGPSVTSKCGGRMVKSIAALPTNWSPPGPANIYSFWTDSLITEVKRGVTWHGSRSIASSRIACTGNALFSDVQRHDFFEGTFWFFYFTFVFIVAATVTRVSADSSAGFVPLQCKGWGIKVMSVTWVYVDEECCNVREYWCTTALAIKKKSKSSIQWKVIYLKR